MWAELARRLRPVAVPNRELVNAVDGDTPEILITQAGQRSDAPEKEAPRAAGRFVFASGARPLAGYTIKRGIGAGGFGEIYYAVSDGGKEVALKLIQRHLDVELRGIRQCLNLKHPNLVALYDARQDDTENWWVVMEYVGGPCLQEVLATHPQGLPVNEALQWLHGLGAGVAYLHDHGIVHRDLKPANIFREDGLVKVGDYGLSKFISCSRRSGHTESIGTVHYMAPEVANGRYGKEIDVYALGIILHELLTGRVPFEGESVGEVLMKHLTAQPDLSRVAEPYRSVIAQALHKDPARRFATVPAMLARLPRSTAAGSGPADVPPATGGASEATDAVVTAALVDDDPDQEPIARVVRRGVTRLRAHWDRAELNPAARAIVLIAVLFGLLLSIPFWLPWLVVLSVFYAIYAVLRGIVLAIVRPHPARWQHSWRRPPLAAHPAAHAMRAAADLPPRAPSASANPAVARAMAETAPAWGNWREWAVTQLQQRTPRQRVSELLGSMLGSSVVAIVIAFMAILITSARHELPPLEGCLWLVLVGVVGSWAVLIPAKFWEGRRAEPALWRFTMLVVGLGLGLFSWALAQFFLIELPDNPDIPKAPRLDLTAAFNHGAMPQALAFIAAFGTLFLIVRWWKQTDPLRASRFSGWTLIFCVVLALVVGGIWQFPQPWFAMAVAVITVSVQLASPWLDALERFRSQRRPAAPRSRWGS